MEYSIIFIALAIFVGLWITWGVGANDLANIMSTALGSHSITARQALMIAVIFEIAGAFLGGTGVSETIRGGILNLQVVAHTPHHLIYGMLSALFAGATWITAASYVGMPVSITNSIVGALIGVCAIILGLHAVQWHTVFYILLSWVLSPTIAGIIAFLLFITIKRSILGAENPVESARRYIPFYLCLVSILLAAMTALKSMDHFHLHLSLFRKISFFILTVIIVMACGFIGIARMHHKAHYNRHTQFQYIEGLFSVLMALTACAMVFAHGSNDVAIAVSPIADIISVIAVGTPMHDGWLYNSMMLFGCLGVIIGLSLYGRKVIETVGSAITVLTPSRAFVATLSAASTVIVSTSIGIPVSATQTLVGAVFGVGLARGIDALNLGVIRNIFMSWVITIPVAAGLATGYFFIFQAVFGR